MKLAQWTGPTRKQDAEAVQALVDKAYGLPRYATDRAGNVRPDATLLEHQYDVVENAARDVAATRVLEDVETGEPAVRPGAELSGAEFGQLTAALARQKAGPDWDPILPAAAQAVELAAAEAAETAALEAVELELKK